MTYKVSATTDDTRLAGRLGLQLPPRLDGGMKTLSSLAFVGLTSVCRSPAEPSSNRKFSVPTIIDP